MRRINTALCVTVIALGAIAAPVSTAQAKCAKWLSFLELGQRLPNPAVVHMRVRAVTQEERRYGSRIVPFPVVVGEVVSVLRRTVDTPTLRGSGDPYSTAGGLNIEHYSVGSEWLVWVSRGADRPKDAMWSDVDFWIGACGQSALQVKNGRVLHFIGDPGMTLEDFAAQLRRVLP